MLAPIAGITVLIGAKCDEIFTRAGHQMPRGFLIGHNRRIYTGKTGPVVCNAQVSELGTWCPRSVTL
jgi:hypothetical protein